MLISISLSTERFDRHLLFLHKFLLVQIHYVVDQLLVLMQLSLGYLVVKLVELDQLRNVLNPSQANRRGPAISLVRP